MGKDKKKVKVFKKKKKPVPEKVIIENLKAKYEQVSIIMLKTTVLMSGASLKNKQKIFLIVFN